MKLNSGFTPDEIKQMLGAISDKYHEPTWALEYIAQLEAEIKALRPALVNAVEYFEGDFMEPDWLQQAKDALLTEGE